MSRLLAGPTSRVLSIALVALWMACGALGVADDRERDDSAEAIKELQGTWDLTSLIVSGRVVNIEDIPDSYHVYEGKKVAKFMKGEQTGLSDVTVDRSQEPFHIDLTIREQRYKGRAIESNKGRVIKGIFKIEGDTLTLCTSVARDHRPSEFASGPDTLDTLAVFTKRKP